MQKVEGSSPFSRSFEKPRKSRGFFVSGVRFEGALELGRPTGRTNLHRGGRRWTPLLRCRPPSLVASLAMPTRLEEIAYEAGRDALADQEALVTGIRQRTGTLLAAHALVASFLGATTIRETGLGFWGWVALASLVLGLIAAAVLLAPWKLKFAVDAPQLYDEFYEQAAAEADADTLGWLAGVGFSYQALPRRTPRGSVGCRVSAAPWAS